MQSSADNELGKLNRRNWIARTINTLASLVAGTVVVSVGTYLTGAPKQKESVDDWADAGDVTDLAANQPHELRFERNRIDGWKVRKENSTAWVVLDPHGQFTAFSPLCTHLGCAYHWEAKGRAFVCPCHGSQFDLQGQVLTGPASRPLDRLQVKLEGNRLWLADAPSSSNPT